MWSVAEEIHYLSKLANVDCSEFRHLIVSSKYPDPLVLLPKSIANYTVPDNFTWLVTHIFFRSLPPVNDPSLTVAGTSSGDFRSDDFEVSGLAKAWLAVNSSDLTTNSVTGNNVSTFGLLNKQVLFAFKGGVRVDLVVQRAVDSIPPNQVVHTAFHGYLTAPKVYSCLAQNLTQIEGIYS